MVLSRTCKSTGICWSGREHSWRESRWPEGRPTTFYLTAWSTFSWTWETWWAKSAIRYPQSSYWDPCTCLVPFWRKWHQCDKNLFCFLLQMSFMQSSWVKHTSPTARAPLNPDTGSKTVWDSRVEGYIILRDLELYLTKLARDFLLLASKAQVTQHWALGPWQHTNAHKGWSDTEQKIGIIFKVITLISALAVLSTCCMVLSFKRFFSYMMFNCIFMGFLGYFPQFLSYF